MRYRDYVLEGARSTPIEVRMPTVSTPASVPEMPQPIPRRAKLNLGDLARHGYTVGCPGCQQLLLGSSIRRNHTEECRRRIESELDKTSGGQERLGRAKERLDTRAAEIGQSIIDNESAGNDDVQEAPQNDIEENAEECDNIPEGTGGDEQMDQQAPDSSTPMESSNTEHFDMSPRTTSKRQVEIIIWMTTLQIRGLGPGAPPCRTGLMLILMEWTTGL